MKEIKDPYPTRIIRILIQWEELVERPSETGKWFCYNEKIMYFVASVFLPSVLCVYRFTGQMWGASTWYWYSSYEHNCIK